MLYSFRQHFFGDGYRVSIAINVGDPFAIDEQGPIFDHCNNLAFTVVNRCIAGGLRTNGKAIQNQSSGSEREKR